jgi:hypothetical protein
VIGADGAAFVKSQATELFAMDGGSMTEVALGDAWKCELVDP